MPVSFPLKTDVSVSCVPVAVLKEPEKIFQTIPNVKGQDKHFGLLAKVNALMVDDSVLLQPFIPQDNERVQRDACKTFRD